MFTARVVQLYLERRKVQKLVLELESYSENTPRSLLLPANLIELTLFLKPEYVRLNDFLKLPNHTIRKLTLFLNEDIDILWFRDIYNFRVLEHLKLRLFTFGGPVYVNSVIHGV